MALKFHGLHAFMPSSIDKNAAAERRNTSEVEGAQKHWRIHQFEVIKLHGQNFPWKHIWLKQGSPNKKATKFGDIQVTWRNFPGNFRNLLPLVGSAFFFFFVGGSFWKRSWISWRWASPWTSNPKVYFGRTFASLRGVKWFSWVLGVWTFVFLVWCQIQFLKLGANQLTFGND